MSQIVIDTDVASYIFNWHSLAQQWVDVLRGSELFLSFMSIAELRMGAITARWGIHRRGLLEHFIEGFEVCCTRMTISVHYGRGFVPMPELPAAH